MTKAKVGDGVQVFDYFADDVDEEDLQQLEIAVTLTDSQGPSEQAERLLESFGDEHCAALALLLQAYVQAERMRIYKRYDNT